MRTTAAPPAPVGRAVERRSPPWREEFDRLIGSDPGLNRLITALRVAVGLVAVIGAEWLFVSLTGALQVVSPVGRPLPADIAVQHHQVVVIAMLLGGVPAMITGIGVNDPTTRGQVVSLLFVPVPVVGALAIGLLLGAYRPVALASFAVLLGVGGWARRFGPRGANSAVLLFIGDFIGFFLYGTFRIGDLGWLAAEVGVAVVTLIVVRVALFRPDPARALLRTQRSYVARARRVATLALAVFDESSARRVRELQRQLVRLNEAALIVDALLGDPRNQGRPTSVRLLHERLFDVELTLTNIARFTEALARIELSEAQCGSVRQALVGIRADDLDEARGAACQLIAQMADGSETIGPPDGTVARGRPPLDRRDIVIPHRFARSVIGYCDALEEWLALGENTVADAEPVSAGDPPFEPAVALRAGWLPGSADVSEQASSTVGPRRGERVKIPANVRIGIQMGVAVGVAVVAGDALSPRRFYWAVLAAFISFLQANHVLEQIRKAVFRVLGTVIGIVIGSLLVNLVGGNRGLSLMVIVVFIFLGVYLLRLNYTFLCIGITVTVSQLYVQFGEFSNSLLLLRLEETVVGAAGAVLTVLLVLPLRTRRVIGVALAEQLVALRTLAGDGVQQLVDPTAGRPLLADARAVDSAYQALLATAQPLRRSVLGDVSEQIGSTVAIAGGSRNYARNLVVDAHAARGIPDEVRDDIEEAGATLSASIDVLVRACGDDLTGTYVRSSALLDRVQRRLGDSGRGEPTPAQLVIRDLQLLDGALARLAQVTGAAVTNFDTVPAGCAEVKGG